MLCIGEGRLSIPHTRKVFEDTPFREKKFLHFYSQLLYNPPVASSRRRELKRQGIIRVVAWRSSRLLTEA